MATYEDTTEVVYEAHEKYRSTHKPGVATPYSGIYICVNCRDEIAANRGNPLPPQNHRQHTKPGPIEWRLLVCTQVGPQ